jgi:hypothetical protein
MAEGASCLPSFFYLFFHLLSIFKNLRLKLMRLDITRLCLVSPLFYTLMSGCFRLEGKDPFSWSGGSEEELYCFELNPAQAQAFEPDGTSLLGPLLFAGRAVTEPEISDKSEKIELPAGNYLFCQERNVLRRDEILEMAVELQQEGLWQRLECGERLYLRYLFEDGQGVTQVFRPYRVNASVIPLS